MSWLDLGTGGKCLKIFSFSLTEPFVFDLTEHKSICFEFDAGQHQADVCLTEL